LGRQITLPALNAEFRADAGRSRGHYRAAEVDPELTFMTAAVNGQGDQKADVRTYANHQLTPAG
jgi:hypothetical protein